MKPFYKRVSLFTFVFICCAFAYYFGYTSVLNHTPRNPYNNNSVIKNLQLKLNLVTHSMRGKLNPPLKTSPVQNVSVQTKSTCKTCVPNNIPLLLENKDICKTDAKRKTQLDLFIIIFTQFKSKNKRNTIRNTWLNHSKNNTANVRYVFAFGRLPSDVENKELSDEAKIYKDIVQGDFKDCYRNLTYKTITMLGWVSKYCPQVKHVMKTDDDMWVNIPGIIRTFTKVPLKKTVAGVCPLTAQPIRSTNSKWYVSYEEYSRDTYPGFCSGTGYVMDIYTAASISKVSVDVPFLYLEDVYVALCIEHLGNGFHLQPTGGFYNSKYDTNNLCDYHQWVLTSHYMSIKAIKNIWNAKC